MQDEDNHLPQRILVFGGTFDPPHLAHAILPAQAAVQLSCDRILYVPAAVNPLKTNQPLASNEDRLAMLLLATADIPNAKISTIELDRPGPSYTVDTLRAVRQHYARGRVTAAAASRRSSAASIEENPEPEFRLLIGCDQALDFHRWKEWQQILTLATPAVMVRPPWNDASFRSALEAKYSEVEAESWKSWTLRLPLLEMNATEIRQRLRAGDDKSVRDWLDPAVLDYIRTNRLYTS